MFSDLRFVVRALVRNRSFTLVTILTLALGIGSAAAIFNVTDWVLFRANEYPSDVYLIGGHSPDQPFMPIRFPFMVRGYEQQTGALSELSKAAMMPGNVVLNGEPIRPGWLGVTPNFLEMLGITPGLGRGFLAEEGVAGKDNVVIISHRFWQSEFGGSEDILGKKIVVGEAVCTVVGVLRHNQALPPYFWNDVYRPLVFKVDPAMPWMPNLFVLGRLHPGVTREQAAKALATVPVDTPAQMRPFLEKEQVALSSLPELNQAFRMEIYWVLVGAVGFLYAIACLNASNLMLVRMLGQQRELSIRLALGGGRWRIVRLLALESVAVALVASILGALVANWIFPLLLSAAGSPGMGPDWKSWNLGTRVLAVLGGLSVATSLFIVTIPALRMLRTEIHPALKDGGAALGEGRGLARLRGGFVVLQAAFAVILLTGAGLMVKTFQNLQKVDLGFDPSNRVKVQISVPPDVSRDWQPWLARMRGIQAQLQRVPGVRAVSFGDDGLLPGFYFAGMEVLAPDGKKVKAALSCQSLGDHEASGLRLKGGRWLTQSNGNDVMVNETLARTLWPGKDPVGQLLPSAQPNPAGGPNWKGWLVVGVVGDVRSTMREAPKNYIYGPEAWSRGSTFVVKFAGEYSALLAGQIKKSLYAFDRALVVFQIMPLTEVREQQLWMEKMANSVLKVLAGIALVLTIVGIFSVLAYTVDRRMGEFGVRMALGATRRDLVALVMRRGVLLTGAGVLVGIGGALGLTRSLQTLLFEVSPQNPAVLVLVAVLLIVAAVLGCLWPALRATTADVSKLLRSE